MASKEQFLQKQNNVIKILDQIRLSGKIERMNLVKNVGLSWACVSAILSELIDQGLVVEEKTSIVKRGRAPSFVKLNANKCVVGIDVNVAKITACACDLYGKEFKRVVVDCDFTNEQVVCEMTKKAIQLVIDGCTAEPLGIGIAMQGVFVENTKKWKIFTKEGVVSIRVDEFIKNEFGLPIVIEHDPNCMLLGVLSDRTRSAMLVRIDRGVGASIYKDGFFKDGKLELGKMIIDGTCRLEDYFQPFNIDLAHIGKEEIENLERAGKYLGVALANVCNLIDVDEIIITGKTTEYADYFLEKLDFAYNQNVLDECKAKIRILNEQDASLGASHLAVNELVFRRRV